MKNHKAKTFFRSKLWTFLLAGVIVLPLTACGEGSSPATTEAPATAAVAPTEATIPETQPPEAEPKKEFYQVGDTVEAQGFEITYLASGEYIYPYAEIMSPAEGNHFIFLKFSATNITPSRQFCGIEGFQCYVDGDLIDSDSIAYLGDNELNGYISAGRTMVGYIYFEVPVEATNIEVAYDHSFNWRHIDGSLKPAFIPKFLYEGEQDSGLSGAGNPDPTPNATQVGDTEAFPNFNANYLSAYLDKSIRTPAKEGYHYVTCEIEYENLSSDELSIGVLCFADGLNCEMLTFQRKGDIIGRVPSGETATGIWTFEVPDGAAVVEFEHEICLAHTEGDGRYTLDNNITTLIFDASNTIK